VRRVPSRSVEEVRTYTTSAIGLLLIQQVLIQQVRTCCTYTTSVKKKYFERKRWREKTQRADCRFGSDPDPLYRARLPRSAANRADLAACVLCGGTLTTLAVVSLAPVRRERYTTLPSASSPGSHRRIPHHSLGPLVQRRHQQAAPDPAH
jgi:hypothetical protein